MIGGKAHVRSSTHACAGTPNGTTPYDGHDSKCFVELPGSGFFYRSPKRNTIPAEKRPLFDRNVVAT